MRRLLSLLLVVLLSANSLTAGPEPNGLPPAIIAEVKASYNEKAPSAVTGVVFADANGNGLRDDGEDGLAGVGVTDGVSIVESGADGSYTIAIRPDPTIPWTPARTVSVCWPSGYWPVGTPWRRLSDVPDGTGVTFPLRKQAQTFPFAFCHITDDHGAGALYPTYAKDLHLLGGMPRFVVSTGDMLYVNGSTPGLAIAAYRSLMANVAKADFGVPFLAVPGNHDNTATNMKPEEYDPKHPLFCHGVYTKSVGPVRWSFDYGGCHFIGLDWKSPSDDPKALWEDAVPQAAADWLRKDLARVPAGRRVFAFVHFPSGVPEFHKAIGRATWTFAGHNHRVQQYRYGGPSITGINLHGNGSSNIGIVTEKDFAVVTRCPGCKESHSYHSKLCGIGYRTKGEMPQRLAPIRGEATNLPACDLGSKTIGAGGKGIEIEVAIAVGSARRVGLKVGDQEIAFDGEFLHVAGIPIPFKPWPEQNNTLALHVAASSNMLIVYANDLIRTHKPAAVGDASKVTIFAEGGSAKLTGGTVRLLKDGVQKVLEDMGFRQ